MNILINYTNHNLTEEQMEGFDSVSTVPFPAIKPTDTVEDFKRYYQHDFIDRYMRDSYESDVYTVLIAGEPSYVFYAVNRMLNIARPKVMPVSAITERISKEEIKDDGTVVKTSQFKHLGFRAFQK